MPQIRQYTQQTGAQGSIPGRAAEAGPVGAAIYGLGTQLAHVGNQLEEAEARQDVTDAHAKVAKARGEWTVHLKERADAAPLGDTTFAGKFNDDLTNYLAETRAGIKTKAGQQAFDREAATLQGQMFAQAGLYQAESAGRKAKADYGVLVDSNRNTLLSDPTQFGDVLKQTMSALDDPNGQYARLPSAAREELRVQTRQQLALSTVDGLVKNGAAELAKRQLMEGKWDEYLDADKKSALIREADVGIKAKDVEAERVRKEQERLAKEAIRATQEGIIQKLASNSLTTKDILASNLPAVGDGSKEHFLNVLRTRSKEAAEAPIKTIPSVMLNLFDDIRSGRVTTTGPIEARYLMKQVSFEDMNRLRKELVDMRGTDGEKMGSKKKAFFDGIKPQIDKSNPLMGKLDPSGAQAFYEFSDYVDRQVEGYRATGKNVFDLFDPSKPDYLGKPETVKAFQKPLQASIRDVSARVSGAPEPLPPEQQRKPGESIADWRKRTAQ